MNIRIAICGYGNLGRGVEHAAMRAPDITPAAIFTRRPPEPLRTQASVPVLPISALQHWREQIDVLILCGGSAKDLPRQTPTFAADFNTVDSFDTHAAIPAHFAATDRAASASGHLALISAGWDPGLFSVARTLFDAFLPDGETATFWGRGVSQGHSDALRRIPGVLDAREYTVPIDGVAEAAEAGQVQPLPRLPRTGRSATSLRQTEPTATASSARFAECPTTSVATRPPSPSFHRQNSTATMPRSHTAGRSSAAERPARTGSF